MHADASGVQFIIVPLVNVFDSVNHLFMDLKSYYETVYLVYKWVDDSQIVTHYMMKTVSNVI